MRDIVYFVKDAFANEELRYSLRSVERNLPHRKVWFYGGCPAGILPDEHVAINQTGANKWAKVRNMIRQACENEDITKEFYLFNDDFYVMRPTEEILPMYDRTIYHHIVEIEDRHDTLSTNYSRQLRDMARQLRKAGYGDLNYAIHVPIPIDRKKAIETLDKFPNCPMFRALYGNMHGIGGIDRRDVKIIRQGQRFDREADLLSTSDKTFESSAGSFIRETFPEKSRFET